MLASLPSTIEQGPGSRQPLHVLTITPFYPTSSDDAQGCFIAEPLTWLERAGVRNTVLAVQPFYRKRLQPSASAHPAQWSHYFSLPGGMGLPAAGTFLFGSLLAKARRLHQAQPISLIHAHSALPCGHAASLLARELRIPFVVTVHGLDAYFTRQVRGLAGEWCARVCKWVYRSAHRVICISEKVRERVLERATVNTVVVYNGVDPGMFSPSSDDGGSEIILSVGNLIPIKGHELLLRAFAAVQQRFPESSCEIIGDGPERSRLLALTSQLGIADRVRFPGRKNRGEVARLMRDAAVFALPSTYEGLGCVYLEAMASGKPAVGCRGQGIEEVIQHGRNGWLIGPGNLSDMTDALAQLLQDAYTRRQMGEAARWTILSGFTLERQAALLAQVYRGCTA